MLSIFQDVKSNLKVGGINIDNWVFKLHYKLSVLILVVFSIIVNSRQYFGDPIDCTVPDTEISKTVDTYCWFNSYSLVDWDGNVFLNLKKLSQSDIRQSEKVKQTYYQWIGIVLLLQAGLFYAPRFLWKNLFEEGRVKELVNGLQSHVQDDDVELIKRLERIIKYVQRNKGHHLFYALKFFFCEVLNFANVAGQIFLTDWFLGHAFLKYGFEWLSYDSDNDEHQTFHPSDRYFPKETLCDISYGSAGQSKPNFYQARCVLPIHIFNEKIYLFLWFYFITLALISGLTLIYRQIVLLIPGVRYFLFARRAWATDEVILRAVIHEFDIGDWFIIYLMMKNMDPSVFTKLMQIIYENQSTKRIAAITYSISTL